jgi:hypothetical protein
MTMDRICFTITSEPKNKIYRDLLDYGVNECAFALIVIRPSLPLSEAGTRALKELEQYLHEERFSSEWPGTTLLAETARVLLYQFGSECASVLEELTSSLYSWQQPNLPEDLCLLRANEEPWLVSIAHERDSFLYLLEDEKSQLLKALPHFAPILMRSEDG